MDREFVEINVNNWVKVKLTPKGEELLERKHYQLYETIRKRVPDVEVPLFKLNLDEEGYYRDQMWSFMNTFGPHTYVAREQLFETQLLIEKNA